MEKFTNEEIPKLLELAQIPKIEDDTNYWFVRTSGGYNFEKFYFGNYIAIGWDKLNDIEELKYIDKELLKKKIEENYTDDVKPGSTASQILRFVNDMKIGDYVLIPGSNCDRIAFGIITSDVYVYELTEQDKLDIMFDGVEYDFLKRRKIEWISERPFDRKEMDPLLIPIIYSYGTIVDANPYADFINRTLYNNYYTNGRLHSIFNISTDENISAYKLNKFIDNIFSAMDLYSDLANEETDKKEIAIKASINSPGPVEIITAATSALIVIAGISLFLNGATVKFSFNIFNIISGEIDISSKGLLDKLAALKSMDANNVIKIKEVQEALEDSKRDLKIQKKKKKK